MRERPATRHVRAIVTVPDRHGDDLRHATLSRAEEHSARDNRDEALARLHAALRWRSRACALAAAEGMPTLSTGLLASLRHRPVDDTFPIETW